MSTAKQTRTFAHPGELPITACCDDGWLFEIYHPRIANPGIQLIEVWLYVAAATLGDAFTDASTMAYHLAEQGLMAGEMPDSQTARLGWHPCGVIDLDDGREAWFDEPCYLEAPAIIDRSHRSKKPTKGERITSTPFAVPGIRCDDGWIFDFGRHVVATTPQIVSLRAANPEPELDAALADFTHCMNLLQEIGLVCPTRDGDPGQVRFTFDPVGDPVTSDGQPVRFERVTR